MIQTRRRVRRKPAMPSSLGASLSAGERCDLRRNRKGSECWNTCSHADDRGNVKIVVTINEGDASIHCNSAIHGSV
jgi:hypothetical protein